MESIKDPEPTDDDRPQVYAYDVAGNARQPARLMLSEHTTADVALREREFIAADVSDTVDLQYIR